MRAVVDMVGRRIGRLVVVQRMAPHPTMRGAMWLCLCDCGGQTTVVGGDLRRGEDSTRSCGCSSTEHGHARANRKTVEYITWRNLRRRVRRPSAKDIPYYAGVTVCERWSSFAAFLADMGPRPGPGYSIDRINCTGNYEPSNCRWATAKQQNENRRHWGTVTRISKEERHANKRSKAARSANITTPSGAARANQNRP